MGWQPGNQSYDGARTDRINEHHWSPATGQDINAALLPDLATLRTRADHELRNNPDAVGLALAFADDLIGESGPTLQILVDDEGDHDRFVEQVEYDFNEWLAHCDLSTGDSLIDLLWTLIYRLLPDGDFTIQRVTEPDQRGPVKLALLPIAAPRIETPLELISDDRVHGGVRVDANLRPVEYYVLASHPGARLAADWWRYSPLPARDVLMYKLRRDVGQVRGEPRLASVLQHFERMRKADQYTIDAMWQAALLAAFITNRSDIPSEQPQDNTDLDVFDIEPGTLKELAEGQSIQQVTPQHPNQQYDKYMRAQHARSGRPVGMPRARVTGDAEGHTYSSLRAIRTMYGRALRREQGALFRRAIVRIFGWWWEEYELAMRAGLVSQVGVPQRWRIAAAWEPLEDLDQVKAAQAREMRMGILVDSLDDALRAEGRGLRAHLKKLAYVKRQLEKHGLSQPARTRRERTNA